MKKSVLFIIVILIVFSVVLFVNVNQLNEEEILYEGITPPDMELTDGFSSIISTPKIENWYFRGKDNRFHPIHYSEENNLNSINEINDEKISKTYGNRENRENNEAKNDNTSSLSQLYYTGNLKLKSKFNPDNIILQIFNCDTHDTSETIIFEDSNLKFEKSSPEDELWECSIFQPKEDGRFIYRIPAFWNEPKTGNDDNDDNNDNRSSKLNSDIDADNINFYGKAIYEFSFINDVPIEFHVSSSQTYPGEIITIFAKYANEEENITLKTELFQSELPFYSYDQGKFAILPISYTVSPSDYTISLQVERTSSDVYHNTLTTTSSTTTSPETSSLKINSSKISSSEISSYDITIHVLPKDFPIQHLTISTEIQQATQNDAAYEEYDKYVGAVRKTNTPVKMWEGIFIQPVEGRISTEFGMRRFVNNAPTSYRHSGIDIAADKGVPIKASNSGKVILSRYLTLTGNTVLIDHGYGIISWYYHMDTISVNEGDMIEKGQIIGTVGSTGFSTGPHLHFSISVHDVFANPWTFFKQEPVIFE